MSRILPFIKRYPLSLLCIVVIWYLCLLFGAPETRLNDVPFIDKWVHTAMYFGTCGIIWLEYLRAHRRADGRKLLIWAVAAPIAMSGLVELAQAYATVGALTLSGDTITSMVIDAVQANVNFNAAGTITTDLAAAQPSKNELGADYGMGKVSSIGKEWDEQAAAFASYVTGKTVAEATGIAVTEEGNAGDADLAASVTIGVGDFLTLVEKAGA